ncbi:HAMP domain-containing protein [Methylomonas sp. LL1]|uniref:ATP-binding protein n=1 Tax=Methylomonas sp. LL1 TaxID=2785785 RepID=UPI0018C39D09|nr:ATP-binding protein [Methylomonas sp. LL1]QPK65143.1 HAMP domain-containing protein [Methylomonas sp. LL1]
MGRLFWKFFFAFWLALLTAGIGVGTAIHTLDDQQRVETRIDRHAGMFVTAAANVLQYGGLAALRDFIGATHDKPLPPVYAVDDEDRDILQRTLEPEVLSHARALYLQQADTDAVRLISATDGHRYLLFVAAPEHGFGGLAPPALDDGRDGPPPHQQRHGPPKPPSPLLPIVAGLLASLLFSALLAWYFAKPIRGLRNAFAAVSQGNLSTRVAQAMGKRHDELADLGRDFDHMAAQLDSLISAQQRLLHDVSHELRSPLARMQAAIGIAQQQPDKIAETLWRIERESQRISDLVGELLVLSRLEAGVDKSETADIDLSGLLLDIVEDARFEAEQRQIKIHYRGLEDVMVKGRGELLHRAVENVLRNAVQHCHHGGEVKVAAMFDATGRQLQMSVDDQGPGVNEADLTAIFQPFFRSGQPNRPNSVGLGLTIAHRALAALGGTIQASNRPEGGLRIKIMVPFPATT